MPEGSKYRMRKDFATDGDSRPGGRPERIPRADCEPGRELQPPPFVGEDLDGEMGIVEQGNSSANGEIRKIAPASRPASCTAFPADMNGDAMGNDQDFALFATA